MIFFFFNRNYWIINLLISLPCNLYIVLVDVYVIDRALEISALQNVVTKEKITLKNGVLTKLAELFIGLSTLPIFPLICVVTRMKISYANFFFFF